MISAITWDEDAHRVAGHPTATVTVDRAVWEATGASFVQADDGDGETPWLATGILRAIGDAIPVGVLSYDERIAYLLVTGERDELRARTESVLAALSRAGVLDADRDVLEVLGTVDEEQALDTRVRALENAFEAHVAESERQLAMLRTGDDLGTAAAQPVTATATELHQPGSAHLIDSDDDVVAAAGPGAHRTSSAMRMMKTTEAAAPLNVSPNTLRAWERRFGYPKPLRSAGRHRLYTGAEVVALRDALQQGLALPSAMIRARDAVSADADAKALVDALARVAPDRADSAMESALAVRSVARSVEDVLLPSLDQVGERYGFDSAPWASAAGWANDWLRRALRLAPPPARTITLLVGDATGDELDRDAVALRAFELFCWRSGVHVTTLPVAGVAGLTNVVESLSPDAAVIAGSSLSDDSVGLWAYRVRAAAGPLQMALFGRTPPGAKMHATGTRVLPERPWDAHRELLSLLDERSTTPRLRDVASAVDIELRRGKVI